jgi:hypothetical protein
MAFSSKRIKSGVRGDGTYAEYHACFFNAVQTGTVQLATGRDLRRVLLRFMDASTVAGGTAVTVTKNIETGVVTLAAAVADNALTGEAGGAAGSSTFTATGAVIGQTVAGTGVPAEAVVTSVSGTTVKIDKVLTAAVGTDIVGNTYGILEAVFC